MANSDSKLVRISAKIWFSRLELRTGTGVMHRIGVGSSNYEYFSSSGTP